MNEKQDRTVDPMREQTSLQERVRTLEAELAEQKRLIDMLKEGEERFRIMFESAPDAYYLNDLKGVFLNGNRAAEELIGYQRAELIGKSYLTQNILPLKELLKAAKLLARNALGMRTGPDLFTLIRKDGAPVQVEISTTPVKLQGRTVILGIARNVTDRLRAEAEQRSLQAQLLQAQKMEAVGQLTGGIAHDFNNVITAVKLYGELGLMQHAAGKPLKPAVERILGVADKASNLVKGLLAFSRKPEPERRLCDMNDITVDIRYILSRVLGDDIQLDIALTGKDVSLIADPTELEQVLINLGTNARDAMPEGGRIAIETGLITIDTTAGGENEIPRGSYVTVVFADTGIGMDRKIQNRIFEPFFTTKAGKGTGLGLAIVKRIVAQHGGFIKVESAPGKGTRFTLYFPRQKQASQAPAVKDSEETLRGGSETILLAEDDADVRSPAHDILERFGYTVIEAADGRQARGILQTRANQIDLIVTDLIMPNGSGEELLLEARRTRRPLPALIITGDPGRGAGCREPNIMAKPFSPSDLIRRVREILDGRG